MITDAEGDLAFALNLRDEASKGSSGRVIPLNKELRTALQKLHDQRASSPYVITTRTSPSHISCCNRQPLCSVVQRDRSKGLLQPLRTSPRSSPTQRAQFSTVGGSLRDGPNARWTSSAFNHPALYRSGRRSTEESSRPSQGSIAFLKRTQATPLGPRQLLRAVTPAPRRTSCTVNPKSPKSYLCRAVPILGISTQPSSCSCDQAIVAIMAKMFVDGCDHR